MNGCSLQYIEEHKQSYLVSYASLKDNMKDKQYLQTELQELMTKQVYPFSFGLSSYFRRTKVKLELCKITYACEHKVEWK